MPHKEAFSLLVNDADAIKHESKLDGNVVSSLPYSTTTVAVLP